MMLGFRALLNH